MPYSTMSIMLCKAVMGCPRNYTKTELLICLSHPTLASIHNGGAPSTTAALVQACSSMQQDDHSHLCSIVVAIMPIVLHAHKQVPWLHLPHPKCCSQQYAAWLAE